jgi:hypothetical protein
MTGRASDDRQRGSYLEKKEDFRLLFVGEAVASGPENRSTLGDMRPSWSDPRYRVVVLSDRHIQGRRSLSLSYVPMDCCDA